MGFLDDLGKGLNKMGKKTSDMAAVAKVKLEITKIKSKIDKKYEELGSRMYFLYIENLDQDDSVKKLYEEIDELFESVNQLELELIDSEAVELKSLVCAKCGEELDENMRFCGSCGAKTEIKVICKNCGEEVKDVKFCNSCGASID